MSPHKRSHILLFAFVSSLFVLSGCDEPNLNQTPNKPEKTVAVKKDDAVPVHRFVITRSDYNVAFDTQTGQLCRTWGWEPLGKSPKPDPETGGAPQRQVGEFTPTCLLVYQQYPSGKDTQSGSVTDEQPAN
jgi:hypothetical protein